MAGTPGENKRRIFSLTFFGVLLLIAVIVVNFVVWKSNQDKQSQINGLHQEISQVQQKIKGTPGPASDLDARLAAANAALVAAQNALPGAVDRNDVIDFIIATAEQCQVQAIPLNISESSAGKAGQSYQVLQFSTTVTGSLANATNFLTTLQGGQFLSLTITGCIIKKSGSIEFLQPEYQAEVTIDLTFAIYTAAAANSEDNAS